MHSNRSAEGVSLITQIFYAAVFFTRYLDLFPIYGLWNFTLKIFYMASSVYIIFVMLRVYARTREREKAWKLGGFCLAVSSVGAPLVMLIFRSKSQWGFSEVLWIFSIILESVCVLPQLLLLRQTTVPTVIDSYYLLTLGAYRGLYILNWIWRELDINDRKPDPISIVFGVIQTAFYVDFAWVYYSRQRVKLRNGGMVDADDLRNGWLLRRIFGSKRIVGNVDSVEDEESVPALRSDGTADEGRNVPKTGPASKWGSRGISVSADEGVLAGEEERQRHFAGQESGVVDALGEHDLDGDAKMKDPDEMARILDDDDESNDGILPAEEGSSSVGNGAEWRK
ncbi:hypothetical protein BP5796_06862 [Coleophoma crateriformis]|uniref:Uncharacterized protein n=1 Tax=Coleophoma crateriformis TaxID=565419 RepID=A0A3D8RQF5_9HELO|nr:hypothetical protein BP5796_06862 [Coleophoma crateriformis]